MTTLELRAVSVDHAAGTPWETPALHEIELTLTGGDRVLIVGGNGSGKSTLLSVLAGLIKPTRGTAVLDGRPLSDQPDRIGLLLQNTRLQLNRPTVQEELADMARAQFDIPAVVSSLGLATLLNRRIDELSGGQQRRVGLAGALLRRADVLLLDEPLAGLDQSSSEGLLAALGSVPDTTIVVVVTHDFEATEPVLNHGRTGRVLRISAGRIEERERL